MYDVAIIGCGIIGAAAAYELSRYRLRVAVLERENDIAAGTTKANSAILHAGYDPAPDTRMAKLNVEGVALAKELCNKLDVPYRQTGSLVLAFDETDLQTVQRLYERGSQNGVPELRVISAEEVRALEPQLAETVVGALFAPSAAIVCPWEYALALAETAVKNGVELFRNCEVQKIEKIPEGFRVTGASGVYEARYLINAAGVFADRVQRMAGEETFTILPNRGQYYLLDKCEGTRVNHVVFQCPNQDGKGVLVAPTVHGNLIVGPNAENVVGDNTATTGAGLEFVARMAQKSVPSISLRNSIRNFAGVRAQSAVDDFLIEASEQNPGLLHLAGIKSPGLSAAPAIAKLAVELLEKQGLPLLEKSAFIDTRKRLRFQELSEIEKAAAVRKNPAYGRVICRCETITEGEILDALHTPIPPVSVDGVKRRCNAGMGRCQGGFCGPRVVEILAREQGVSPTEILMDKKGTNLLVGETKKGEREDD